MAYMARNLHDINTEEILLRNDVMLTEKFSFSMDLFIKSTSWIKTGEPYLYNYTHLMHILGGTAHYNINLREYTFNKGDIIIISKNSILEMHDLTDDYHLQVVSLKDDEHQSPYCQQLKAMDDAGMMAEKYFGLINDRIKRGFNDVIIDHLTLALREEFFEFYRGQERITCTSNNRSTDIFHRFLSFVSQYSSSEHNIDFYAGKLFLSPRYLSTIIKEISGRSMMYWVNASVINKAKIALQYTDKPIIDISQELHFNEQTSFTRFFKHLTGMTPTEYRNK